MRNLIYIAAIIALASCKTQQRVAYYEKKVIIHDTLIQVDTTVVFQPDTTVITLPCDTVERVVVKESSRSKVVVRTGKQGTTVQAICKEAEIRLKFQRLIRRWYNHIIESEKVEIKAKKTPLWLIILATTGCGLLLYRRIKVILTNIKRLWLS